jgi:hypothetical protein
MRPSKADKSGHHPEVAESLQGDHHVLTARQQAAVEAVAAGLSDTAAAKAAGVTRQTVSGWRHHDALFAAAVNARRREIWDSVHDRLRGLALKAAAVLEAALGADLPMALQAAAQVLKCFKFYGSLSGPEGPVTVEAVLAEQAEEAAKAELAARLPTGDPLQSLLAEAQEVPELAQKHLERLRAAWEAARQEAPQ